MQAAPVVFGLKEIRNDGDALSKSVEKQCLFCAQLNKLQNINIVNNSHS